MPAHKVSTARAPLHLIAGGRGLDRPRGPDPLLQAVVRGTGLSRPSVAYVGAASGDNRAFFLIVSRMMRAAGAGKVTLAPLCGRRADPAAAQEIIRKADIVFISGGDVEEGMRVLADAGMLPFLRRLRGAGKPFFGISAGSIMLARSWVRWTNPKDDKSAELFSCMGFAPVLCDTHGEGDGWSELKALLCLAPVGSTGYGIASGSGLVVHDNGTVAATGGEVHVFRRRKAGVLQQASLLPAQPARRGR
jgi:cyanophycinase-like exopeptidase